MFGIYRRLYIVGYFRNVIARNQLAAVRVSGRYLRISILFQLNTEVIVKIFSVPVFLNFSGYNYFIVFICLLQCFVVFIEPVFDIFKVLFNLAFIKVIFLTVLSP